MERLKTVMMTNEGYYVDGVLTDEDDPILEDYLNGTLPMIEEIEEEPLDQEEIKVMALDQISREITCRVAKVATLQTKAIGTPSEPIIDIILRYASVPIEKWKNTGDALVLNTDLTSLTGVNIRRALDLPVNAQGVTAQQYLVGFLSS